MLKELNVDNETELNIVQSKFSVVYKQKSELINTLKTNPYVKIYTYGVDNNVIGLIQFQYIYDRIELDNIYVLENYRKKGIATIMMDFLIEFGLKEKATNITLEVREDNIGAIRLYEKYGFEKKAIRKNYYNGCDGILMERKMM